MKTHVVVIRPDRVYLPLVPLGVGRMSSALVSIRGDIPDDIETFGLVVEYMAEGQKARYTARAAKQDDGTFLAYLAPIYFPEADPSLKYHVVGRDVHGNPRWFGCGNLNIMDTPLDASEVLPLVVPDSDIRIALEGLSGDTLSDVATQREVRQMVQKILACLKAAAAGSTSGVDPVSRRTVVYDDRGEPHFMSVVRDDSGELTSVIN